MAVQCGALRRNSTFTAWVAFFTQVLIAISFQLGDDLGRGLFAQHGTVQGIANARRVVTFESQHGFFVEPAWQMFFLHTRHILSLTISWIAVEHVVNTVYVFGHVVVTLGVAMWVYFYRRQYFALMRNTVILVNAFALIVYENFPVAPPRLTGPVRFDRHTFHFQDTVFGIMDKTGHAIGSQVSFNEFSAMPSVHMAWAVVAGVTVACLARPLIVKVIGALYPFMMLVAVVVSGNHYLLDVVGALAVVACALSLALGVERYRQSRTWPSLARRENVVRSP
jgi:membrane-associated phospholipid phosphatase